MKRIAQFALPFVLMISAVAQTGPAATPASGSAPIDVQLANTLIQLQKAAEDANVALGRLRIDKWKTGRDQKQQTQQNVVALQKNLSAALPELLQNERNNPQDLTVNFKLYRNLSAVYDVLASVTESAGAFGPKDDYEALAQPVSVMDSVRRQLADRLESLSASKEAEISHLKAQIKLAATPAVPATVKKIVVDDNESAHKTKKTKAKAPEKKAVEKKPE